MQRKIKKVAVLYEGGGMEEWDGDGHITFVNTNVTVEAPTENNPKRTQDLPVKYITVAMPVK